MFIDILTIDSSAQTRLKVLKKKKSEKKIFSASLKNWLPKEKIGKRFFILFDIINDIKKKKVDKLTFVSLSAAA